MTENYFVNVSEAHDMAFGTGGGGRVEEAERRLKSADIEPAGHIKGRRGNEIIFKPFYDPSEIKKKTEELAEIDAQLKALQEKRAAILKGAA